MKLVEKVESQKKRWKWAVLESRAAGIPTEFVVDGFGSELLRSGRLRSQFQCLGFRAQKTGSRSASVLSVYVVYRKIRGMFKDVRSLSER